MGSSILCLGLQELLAVAYELLAVACEVYFPDQRSNLGCMQWERSLSHCTSREIPLSLLHLNKSLSNCCCCCVAAKVHLILFDPKDCSQPGSSFQGILQARILEWVAISFCSGSSRPKDQTHVSCISRWILYCWATREALFIQYSSLILLGFQDVYCETLLSPFLITVTLKVPRVSRILLWAKIPRRPPWTFCNHLLSMKRHSPWFLVTCNLVAAAESLQGWKTWNLGFISSRHPGSHPLIPPIWVLDHYLGALGVRNGVLVTLCPLLREIFPLTV